MGENGLEKKKKKDIDIWGGQISRLAPVHKLKEREGVEEERGRQ